MAMIAAMIAATLAPIIHLTSPLNSVPIMSLPSRRRT